MRKITLFLLFSICNSAFAQDSFKQYDLAFSELKGMLTGSIDLSFKRAVFISENAYLDNQLAYDEFVEYIDHLAQKSVLIAEQTDLIYNDADKDHVEKLAAVFRVMTDTIKFHKNSSDSTSYYISLPYRYDFEDFFGEKDWRQMFITKLLLTHKGNCHSLPFLYKIICDQLGVKSYLAMAPNHIYIKTRCKKIGWYNTELTSGYFPIDAWIMASGYVHLNSIQNRIYMDTLSDKQSIAVCLVDLAKGYEKKFGDKADSGFILKACNLALLHYPQYVNGLILKAEILKKQFERQMSVAGVKHPSDMFEIPQSKKIFEDMQNLISHIHDLGYRRMPKEMYATWLEELHNEKYQNKSLSKNLTPSK